MRQKIYQTTYWKESCFALTAESLIEKAVDLKGVGGTYGGQNAPTSFLCLILKMLQVRDRGIPCIAMPPCDLASGTMYSIGLQILSCMGHCDPHDVPWRFADPA